MKPRQQDDRPAVVVTAVAQGGVPAASGVSVATGTAGVAPNPGTLRIRDYHPRTKVPEMPASFHT